MRYLKTTKVSLIKPENNWVLYAIGGEKEWKSSTRIYDLISQGVQTNSEAFEKNDLLEYPCTFNVENSLFAIGKHHIYQNGNLKNDLGPWNKKRYQMKLRYPRCLKVSSDGTGPVFEVWNKICPSNSQFKSFLFPQHQWKLNDLKFFLI